MLRNARPALVPGHGQGRRITRAATATSTKPITPSWAAPASSHGNSERLGRREPDPGGQAAAALDTAGLCPAPAAWAVTVVPAAVRNPAAITSACPASTRR